MPAIVNQTKVYYEMNLYGHKTYDYKPNNNLRTISMLHFVINLFVIICYIVYRIVK